MRRGEIYYIDKAVQTGSEQIAGRPAIIVSSDKCNLSSEIVEVVFLTTAPKIDMATHVTIRSTQRVSTALCEQVTSVSVSRVGTYFGRCTDAEMDEIDTALAISLDIPEYPTYATRGSDTTALEAELKECKAKLTLALSEKAMYENMYNKLLDKIIG